MKTLFSSKLRNLPGYDDLPYEGQNIIDEAIDTLEHHEAEVAKLTQRLKSADIRYQNLYLSRQQVINDFRVGLLLAVLLSILLTSLGFIFI